MARRRHGRFEQSVPAALGRRMAARPVALRPGWMLAGLGLAALLGVGVWVALSPRFYVTSVYVEGAGRVPEGEVLAASGLAQLHILWVDAREAEDRILEQLPSVESVAVSCRLPANCAITVVERAPLLNWETEGGVFWVDAAGGVSPADQFLEGGWIVSGLLPTDEQGRVAQEVVVGLGELMRLIGDQPGRVFYRQDRGLVLEDPVGWRVVLGQGEEMERRLQVYALVRPHLLARGIQPLFVDVRFAEAPYYSEMKEW
jgi:cell division septal protein FtsQ